MEISRELAIKILRYLDEHKDFYFPFLVMNREYTEEDDDFVEVEPDEWEMISGDETYQTFQLWENLQNVHKEKPELLAKVFLEKITDDSLERHVAELARNYSKSLRKRVPENTSIEDYGLNEFIAGKADAYKECLYLIKNR